VHVYTCIFTVYAQRGLGGQLPCAHFAWRQLCAYRYHCSKLEEEEATERTGAKKKLVEEVEEDAAEVKKVKKKKKKKKKKKMQADVHLPSCIPSYLLGFAVVGFVDVPWFACRG